MGFAPPNGLRTIDRHRFKGLHHPFGDPNQPPKKHHAGGGSKIAIPTGYTRLSGRGRLLKAGRRRIKDLDSRQSGSRRRDRRNRKDRGRGPLRFARFAPPPGRKGTVCVFPGRAEFIEKYFEVVRDLRARGFAVATIDWRGQGLSDRALPNAARAMWGISPSTIATSTCS